MLPVSDAKFICEEKKEKIFSEVVENTKYKIQITVAGKCDRFKYCWFKEEYIRIVNTFDPEDTIEQDEEINDGKAVRLGPGDPDANEQNPSMFGGAEDMTGGVSGSREEEEEDDDDIDEEESGASDEEDTLEEERDGGEIETRGVKRVAHLMC